MTARNRFARGQTLATDEVRALTGFYRVFFESLRVRVEGLVLSQMVLVRVRFWVEG